MKGCEEFNSIFWNDLNNEKTELLKACLNRNPGLLFSVKHRELLQAILQKKKIDNVLVPAFGLGYDISWIDDKGILAFEGNRDVFNMAKAIWAGKSINLINNDFLNENIQYKYRLIVFTSPRGWVYTAIGSQLRLEREYINKALDCLDDDGIMLITVPANVLAAPLWEETRQRIIDDYSLEMVIYDGNIFPGTGIEWYTILISNRNTAKSVLYSKLDNNVYEIADNCSPGRNDFWVQTRELHDRWDIEYMNPKYAKLRKEIFNKNTTKLGEIAEIIRGIIIPTEERLESGEYMILTPRHIDENVIADNDNRVFFCNSKTIIGSNRAQNAILQNNDIVINLVGNLNWAKYENGSKNIIANHNVAIIRTRPEYARYLKLFFESNTGRDYLKNQTSLFSRGDALRHLSISDLKQFVVPDIKVLETAMEYQAIRNPIIKIKKALTKAGWEVQEEYRFGPFIFDLVLFYDGQARGIVEVKNYKYRDLYKKDIIKAQFNKYKKTIKTMDLFVFLDDEMYIYEDEQLIRMPEIPSPYSNTTQTFEKLYVKDENINTPISIKQLPNGAISLSDGLLIESLWGIKEQLNRMESKIDDITYSVKEMAEKINNYQSLVERQIDRAINIDEVERIIQSFSDECSERIITEVNRNYTEHEYQVEEEKLKASLGIAAWNKLAEPSQTFLTSAKLMYNNLLSIGNVIDYSGVCLLVTKALEVEMNNRFCKNYITYLAEKYPDREGLKEWPTPLLNKYNKRIKTKHFTLGSVAYILCYSFANEITEEQKMNNQDKLLEYARTCLFPNNLDDANIHDCLLQYAEWIEEVRTDYRNPSAHTNELKKIDAENCFDLVVDVEKILKTMLDSFKS